MHFNNAVGRVAPPKELYESEVTLGLPPHSCADVEKIRAVAERLLE